MKKILYDNHKGVLLPATEVIEKLHSKFNEVKDKRIRWLNVRNQYVQVAFTDDKVETYKEYGLLKDRKRTDDYLYIKKDYFAQIIGLKHKFNDMDILSLENNRLKMGCYAIPENELEYKDFYIFIYFNEERIGKPFSEVEEL